MTKWEKFLATTMMLVGIGACGHARAQIGPMDYSTLARTVQPDDFVSRDSGNLISGGTVLRFGGANIGWLGLRSDTGLVRDARYPTDYEVSDAFATANAINATVIRSTTLAASVGCALCLLPAPGGPENDAALKAADHVLKLAHDNGIELILPLVGGTGDCRQPPAKAAGDICTYVRAHGGTDAKDFFTDPTIRSDFSLHVLALLNHVNTETGRVWHDDSMILAFELCDDCAGHVPPALVGKWAADMAALIHGADKNHLVENGAFASQAGRGGALIATNDLAPPGIDIVGIDIDRAHATAEIDAASATDRAVVADRYDWAAPQFAASGDLDDFLKSLIKQRDLSGALIGALSSHADRGGYLPDVPGAAPALYFPGEKTQFASADDMQARARAVRRFDYIVSGVPLPPAFSKPHPPQIISVHGGRVLWRGSAGATSYNIERIPDARVPQMLADWKTVCDHCVTDLSAGWQDPDAGKSQAWYRMIPFDANGHAGLPSDPIENK